MSLNEKVSPTAAFYTLGCKVNQYETEKIREDMEAFGFKTVPFPGPADVLIVNSCTVTTTADSKSRSAIRRATRQNPNALIIATGCSTELDPLTFMRINGVDLVVPNAEKTKIAERIAARFPTLSRNGAKPTLPRLRTRAVVKVQDGCDQFCAYCAVPLARPTRNSRDLEDVLSEIRALANVGYKEVVLTGIRLGSYNDGQNDLPKIVQNAAEIDGIERVRLSSIEVWEVSQKLIEVMGHSKVCRHLHIPLQSGDDNILKAMRRPYNTEFYSQKISQARKAIPNPAITTDVMVGFPGETEEAFQNTCRFVRKMRFSRLHVFRYSVRPDTRAAKFPDQVPPDVKERRSAELIALGEQLSAEFAEEFIGRTVRVLVERRRGRTAILSGLTDNYVEVTFSGPESLRGQMVSVCVTGRQNSELVADLIDAETDGIRG